MPLTPLDAEKISFNTSFRGYNRLEVEQFIAQVVDSFEQYLEQLKQQQERLASLEREVARHRDNEDLLKSSVVLAQKTSDELIAAAHKQADAIKREAELSGSEIRRQLSDLRIEKEQFEYTFHGLLTGFQRRLEQGNPSLTAPAATRPLSAENEEHQAHGGQVRGEMQVGPGNQPEVPPVPTPKVPPVVADMPGPTVPQPRPTPPVRPSGRPGKLQDERDLDADAADFSAALDSAPVSTTSPWPVSVSDPVRTPGEIITEKLAATEREVKRVPIDDTDEPRVLD